MSAARTLPTYAELQGAALLAMRSGDASAAREIMQAAGDLRANGAEADTGELLRVGEAHREHLSAAGRRWTWTPRTTLRGARPVASSSAAQKRTPTGFEDRTYREMSRLARTLLHLPGELEDKRKMGDAMTALDAAFKNPPKYRGRGFKLTDCAAELHGEDRGIVARRGFRAHCRGYVAGIVRNLEAMGNAANRIKRGAGSVAYALADEARSIAGQQGHRNIDGDKLREDLGNVAKGAGFGMGTLLLIAGGLYLASQGGGRRR